MPTPPATPSLASRVLARAFRPFAKVEPGEAISAAVLTFTVFLLLTAYYLLKTAREPLILLHGGAEVKSYASAGQAVLLIGVVTAYGAIARRVARLKLLATVYLFFAANLVVFAILAFLQAPIGVVFYLWVGIFSVTAIAQFWSLAADIYTPEQGKRLFAILGIGMTGGAVSGSYIAKLLVPLGPQALMIGAAVILVVCVVLLAGVDRRASARTATDEKRSEEPVVDKAEGLKLLFKDKYLLLIAAMILILNWVNSTGEYLLDRTLLAAVDEAHKNGMEPEQFVGVFKADYFAWVNLVGMLLQLFAVSRIFKYLGVRAALFFLPGAAFAAYALILFAPLLNLIRVAKVAENSLDYSVQNTARNALYLVATRVEKYVGKTAIDTFVVRMGDVLSAAVVWIGGQFALKTSGFAVINLVLVTLWIAIVVAVGREHKRRSGEIEARGTLEPVPT